MAEPDRHSPAMGPKRISAKLQLVLATAVFVFAGFWSLWNRHAFVEFYRYTLHVPPSEDPIADSYQFDLSETAVSPGAIEFGGADIDTIPALTNPVMVTAREATFLRPTDEVIGVVFGDNARAYPVNILARHEVVNDRVGDLLIAVTYCPLCDSSAVFDRSAEEGEIEFGVSGRLYNSNILFYNRRDAEPTLWSQLGAQELTGATPRRFLQSFPVEVTTWNDWQDRHCETRVLSTQTGHGHDYSQHPYDGYLQGPWLKFSVSPEDGEARLPSKLRVLGVWDEKGNNRAYPPTAFAHHTEPFEFQDELAGKKLTIAYNPEANGLRIVSADEGLQWMYSFWFAWYAFRSNTEIYAPDQDPPKLAGNPSE